ncbi:NUDIX hydrolase [Fusibacter ferrireducens]|uniref:NUDIX domain-containing protein n=1 Tax=Fusibacter ferrireducens TaxID=2785058 RepID=A0ABR9ZV17_9FIRM|nr:NUDIX domain-containing protein [Fusibacter ferrireducens]MBF4694304.1 NUDIX domain-containing protein [Fusibacter ferrireducens]
MTEYLNVYNEDLKWCGSEERRIVHENGKWHYVFHCWVYDQSHQKIILQRRATTKDLFPKSYDASCTGHYSSDENHDSTRELSEELGLEISYDKLIYLLDFQDVFIKPGMLDREIARVHLLITDGFKPLPSTPEEIHSIVACDYEAFKALIYNKVDEVALECLYGDNGEGKLIRSELVPRKAPYYQEVFKHIHEHVKKL